MSLPSGILTIRGAASAYLAGSLVAQLPPATGGRKCQVVQVPAQLEVLVAHPVRVIKIERDASQHRAKNTVRAEVRTESRADMRGDSSTSVRAFVSGIVNSVTEGAAGRTCVSRRSWRPASA